MPKGFTLDEALEIGLTLPGTSIGTAWGARTLEVNGRRFAAQAINKSAEPNSLGVHVEFADRDALIAEQPELYYTAPHYENYPCVLVRLARIHREQLEDLLRMGHRFESTKRPRRRTTPRRSAATRTRR